MISSTASVLRFVHTCQLDYVLLSLLPGLHNRIVDLEQLANLHLPETAAGYNDRQEVERRQPKHDEFDYDDFGRKRKDSSTLSKADRAAAALKRLQEKRTLSAHSSRSRSCSRSPAPDRKATHAAHRDPKPPHAGFRPRGANHRF